ncbi:MAG: MauE/DoxX family redox-associated membrane protein [Acidimicrobiales bacterium]
MSTALLLARVLLSAVFVVSGLAKVADRDGSRHAVEGLGIPRPLADPIAAILPLAELAVAVALLSARASGWGAAGALGLLSLFTSLVALNLASGRRPDCHCFGQLRPAPIGWPTVARNAGLTAIAAWIVVADRPGHRRSAVVWLGRLPGPGAVALAAGVAGALVLAALGWAVAGRARQDDRRS